MKLSIVVFLLFCFFKLLHAEPPRMPVFRLNAHMHSGFIRDIDADSNGDYIVTAGSDKTLNMGKTVLES